MKLFKEHIALIGAIAISTLFNSCEPDPVIPDQEKIYASYKLNYKEKENKTSAVVAFYQGEPSAQNQQKYKLQPPSYVKYNNDELLFDSEKRYYKKEFIGIVESNFEYSNYFGTAYFNPVEMIDSIHFNQLSDSISVQNDLYFNVSTSSLDSNEEVIVEVTSLSTDKTYVFNTTSLSGAMFYISSQELSNLGAGLTTFLAKRKYSTSNLEQVNSIGGDLTVEYETIDTVVLY